MLPLDNSSVAEECWRGAIPVQLRLADSEVSSLEKPPALYFLVPRQSYLHSLVPRALPLLHHLLPPGELVPWFEHGSLPLKWGVPAGVLYDLVAAPARELPWHLTLHFRGFPDRSLPAYGGEVALRGAFFNSLKEAAHICRGSAQRVMEMAGGAQEDLWRQVLASQLAQFRRITAPLQLAPAAGRGRLVAAVPLRVYLRRDGGGYLSSYEDIDYTSRPAPAQAADGSPVSLRQALLALLEECLAEAAATAAPAAPPAAASTAVLAASAAAPPPAGDEAAAAAGEGGADGGEAEAAEEGAAPSAEPSVEASSTSLDGGSSAAAAAAAGPATEPAAAEAPAAGGSLAAGSAAAGKLLDRVAAVHGVLVGGAAPPLAAPLAWLHAQLAAADHFLYVVLHLPASENLEQRQQRQEEEAFVE
ncbi:autophagy 5 [Micractinium conductrix]|uniref:Autophagy protein 5 n=1 Tax=Micractinium conductrix TaxID=554055 RepID=A0A2P6V471_9CHLO|nr:autophagy 5 [Micractinium conductrix]|eukprot:PSC68877.1 autophagy 5 [Micractinium conductrix]